MYPYIEQAEAKNDPFSSSRIPRWLQERAPKAWLHVVQSSTVLREKRGFKMERLAVRPFRRGGKGYLWQIATNSFSVKVGYASFKGRE